MDAPLVGHPPAGAVLAALHDLTARFGYLPAEELHRCAGELGIPLSQLVSAASFYSAFSFKACGRRKLQVCAGTACYVKGATALLERLTAELGIAPDESTADLLFQLKRVRCVGSCGLAPVVRVDEDTYGRLTPEMLAGVLALYQAQEPER